MSQLIGIRDFAQVPELYRDSFNGGSAAAAAAAAATEAATKNQSLSRWGLSGLLQPARGPSGSTSSLAGVFEYLCFVAIAAEVLVGR